MIKSFSINLRLILTVFVIHGGIFGSFSFVTIEPCDTTRLPPTNTFIGLSLSRSSKTKMSAIFPGAIPP